MCGKYGAGSFDSNYKYGYNIGSKIYIWVLNLAEIINMGLKLFFQDYKNGSCFGGFSGTPLPKFPRGLHTLHSIYGCITWKNVDEKAMIRNR